MNTSLSKVGAGREEFPPFGKGGISLTLENPDINTSHDPLLLMASKDTKEKVTTAVEFLEQQQILEEEAAEILPWNFDQCTYSNGYIRQPVYACKTCKPNANFESGGVCYSCSIACHAASIYIEQRVLLDHDLVELFNKRKFRCDCGTARLGDHACQVEPKKNEEINERNQYNHNFVGRFCWCDDEYDAEKEESNMFQCCVCEDWFHEGCVNGEKTGNLNFMIPDLESFEEYICRTCTSKYPFLKQYKHSHMFFSGQFKPEVEQSSSSNLTESNQSSSNVKDSQVVTSGDQPPKETVMTSSNVTSPSATESSVKRKIDDNNDGDIIDSSSSLKKVKVESTKKIPCKLEKFPLISNHLQVDLFCVQGWRDELCRCVK
ncbi:8983_t:CDS:2, partial [Ambispora leptoticha]